MPKVFFSKSPLAQQAILHHMSYDYPTHEVKHVVVLHTSFNSMECQKPKVLLCYCVPMDIIVSIFINLESKSLQIVSTLITISVSIANYWVFLRKSN